MAPDPNSIEHAVSRTLRDSLEKIQRSSEELHQAVNDLVSACASSRPSNALPSMIRAQTSAASISSTLEVLSRFVTSALQSPMRAPYEPEPLRVPSIHAAMPMPSFEQPEPASEHLMSEKSWRLPSPVAAPPAVTEPVAATDVFANAEFPPAMEMPPVAELNPPLEPSFLSDPGQMFMPDPVQEVEKVIPAMELPPIAPPEAAPIFSLDALPPEEQELHRRAYRVAKVSMQDIKMLRPEDVRAGRDNKDICIRLRDDIEKAHKEYDRRFQSIQDHPVDYFYDWMVEILAGGDPQALGEYPYSTNAVRK